MAASYQALERAYRQREQILAAVTDDRADWDRSPPASAARPWPPTPNFAAATPASALGRSYPPNRTR